MHVYTNVYLVVKLEVGAFPAGAVHSEDRPLFSHGASSTAHQVCGTSFVDSITRCTENKEEAKQSLGKEARPEIRREVNRTIPFHHEQLGHNKPV